MLCGLLCTTAFAAGGSWEGLGTQADPYLIEDADDLAKLSTDVNSGASKYANTYFKVTGDIEVSDWNPIGLSSSKLFSGNFDGDGHTITINNISSSFYSTYYSSYAGLFGYLYTGAVVHDVTVDGTISYAAGATGTTYVAGVAGYAYGATLTNCVNRASVTTTSTYSTAYIGGIVAYTNMNTTNVFNCYNSGAVSGGTAGNPRVGGIVGQANSGTFQYCYTADGDVFGGSYATITECYDANSFAALSDGAKDAWVSAANASVSAYTSVTDFWSLGGNGPEHSTCQHTPGGAGVVTDPTCTEKGYTTYTCALCGSSYKGNYTDALGHDLRTVTTPATCTEDGSAVESCAREGCGYTNTTALPATGHTAKAGSETEYDTYYTYVCETCNETYTVYKDARLQAMTIRGVDVSFSADGAYEWEYDEGNARLRSTNYNVGSSTSQTTITMTSDRDFTVSFDYAVSSESNYDKLTITLDSTTVANGVSGTKSDAYTSGTLTAGTHTLVVKYGKDNSGNTGDDRGYLSSLVVEVLCAHENRTQTGHTDATCTQAAYTSYHCGDCGADFTVLDVGSAALGHTWDGDECSVCHAPKTWDGVTTAEPAQQGGYYLIGTGEELAWFAQQVNSSAGSGALNAKLTADINLGEHAWTPIGNYYSSSASYSRVFSGVFDGDGHKITGLNAVSSSITTPMGLFGYVYGGTVKNLAVYGTVMAGVSATISTTGANAGGFVGETNGITMENCANYATVSGKYVGGLIGYVNSTGKTTVSISNSYNAGRVSGTEAGGLIGEFGGSTTADQVTNCFNFGTVSATGNYLGTIYGWAGTPNPTVDGFYYLNAQSYASSYTKGEGKSAEEFQTLAATLGSAFVDSAAMGHPVLTWEVAQTAHTHEYGNYVDNHDGTHTGACAADGETVTEAHALSGDGECTLCGYKEPGSKCSPIQLSTAADLQALADAVNGDGTGAGDSKAGVYYELTADITLPGGFTPIGTFTVVEAEEYNDNGILEHQHYENAFSGHFDGNGHTVTVNITDRTGSNARVGLFGSVAGTAADPAVIENVIVTGSVQTYGGSCVAGLVGYAKNAVIRNCGNGAIVTNTAGEGYYSSNGAAGILGRSDGNVTITGCFNVGAITADGYVAGIVYDAKGSTAITNCYDMGTLTADPENGYAAGIVAIPTVGMNVTLTNCYADGAYSALKPGAIIGTISQAMRLSNVYYRSGNWLACVDAYGWDNTTPATFSDYTALLTGLGDGFKANGGSYPLLSWQTAALTPSTSAHTHSYTDVLTAPTCTQQGYTTHTCACGYHYADAYVDALGHDLTGEATSNQNGTHAHTCLRDGCGAVVTEDCTFDGGVVTTPADKTTDGVRTYTCAVCGYTKTEAIPAVGFDTDESGALVIDSDSALALLAEKVNSGVDYTGVQFVLTADVNSTTPIGTTAHPFTGSFDGGYHTVTVSYADASHDFNGLFGALSGAKVEKVLVAGSITGGSFTAAVAGYASDSVIQYCGSTAAVTGGDNHTYGQNQGPNDCYTGGIVGYATNGTRIVACYNRGAVKTASTKATTVPGGSQYTGGIVGDLYDGSVQYSYNTGSVTSTGTSYTYTGGIAGMSYTSSLISCYSTGAIAPASNTYSGGVLGSGNLYYQQGVSSFYLTGSANKAAGTGADDKEYLVSVTAEDLKNSASVARQSLGGNYVDADGESGNGGYPVLAWESDPTAQIGYITAISTAAQLREFANNVRGGHDYAGETVVLLNDIDLEGTLTVNGSSVTGENIWTAIGDVNGTVFAGTFDGQGYTISHMVLVNDQSGYLGLFSALPQGAVVKNVTVTGDICCSASSVGSIVGWNLGTVENCVSYVDINVSNCEYVGGIVADNGGVVRNCVNNGAVNGNRYSSYVGGIVGHLEPAYDALSGAALTQPVLVSCINTGDVTGYEYVGGIVGGAFNDSDNYYIPDIAACYNAGAVTGSYRDSYGEDVYTGIIAGKTVTGVVNCYYLLDPTVVPASGDISGEDYARPVSAEFSMTSAFLSSLGAFTYTSDGFAVSASK
jgi:hypothetical protein